MAVYNILLILILVLGLGLTVIRPSKIGKIGFVVLVFGYMWFLATFRFEIGFDYNSYINIFNSLKNISLKDFFAAKMEIVGTPLENLQRFDFINALKPAQYESGFIVVSWIMARFINSSLVMYGVYNIFIFVPIAVFIYKYCKDVWLSTWLYVVLLFFYNNMNFIRQGMACSILIFAYKAFEDRRHVKFMLIVLLASLFHLTVLIIIPIYIIAQIKLTKISGAILAGVYVVAMTLTIMYIPTIIDKITDITFKGYKGSQYVTHRLAQSYLIVPVIIFIACACLYPIWRKRNKNASAFLILSLINASIWVIASTQVMILERLSMFTYVFTIAFLPDALRSMLADDELLEQRQTMAVKLQRSGNPPAHEVKQFEMVEQKIKDKKYYYWSAVSALIIITFFANYFSMVERAHMVIPYISVLHTEEQVAEIREGMAEEDAAKEERQRLAEEGAAARISPGSLLLDMSKLGEMAEGKSWVK